jgi:hypothetical protein
MYHRQKERTSRSYCTGISWPLDVIMKCKDVPRSRFILRLVEESLLQSGSKLAGEDQTVAINAPDKGVDAQR